MLTKESIGINIVNDWVIDNYPLNLKNFLLFMCEPFVLVKNILSKAYNKMQNSKINYDIILTVIVAIIITIIGIYLIDNSSTTVDKSNLYVTFYSAMASSLIMILGVVLTIGSQDRNRKNDLEQKEKERKEEDRKKYIPYFSIDNIINDIILEYSNKSELSIFDLCKTIEPPYEKFTVSLINSGRGEAIISELSQPSYYICPYNSNYNKILSDESPYIQKNFIPPSCRLKFIFRLPLKNSSFYTNTIINITFNDFMGNIYKQKISFKFNIYNKKINIDDINIELGEPILQ